MFKRYVYMEGLTTLLGSSGKFLINNDGQIRDAKGNELQYRRDDDGNKVVTCLSWDGERDYRVIDLVALQFKNLQIPKSRYGEVSAFVIDGDLENTHASNVGYRFTAGPIPYEGKQGFFYVPGFPFVAISRTGEATCVGKNNVLVPGTLKNCQNKNIKAGYRTISTKFIKGKQINVLRHRLLCLTFLGYPDNVDSLTVNHKNGTPGDDRLENLEWATRSENNTHAYINDLKSQHKRVLVRNVLTNEVVEYYSISECARKLGYSTDETVRQRLITSEYGKVFSDGTQVKFKDDPRPWIDHSNAEEIVYRSQSEVMARSEETGDIMITRNSERMAELTGLSQPAIRDAALSRGNKVYKGYRFRLGVSTEPWPGIRSEG